MAALPKIAVEMAKELRVNERFGRLLLEERRAAGRSLRAVARKFKIQRHHLQRCEMGRSSPPAKVFYAIMKFYGSAAFFRAAELDMELQLEKYWLLHGRDQVVAREAA